MGQALRTSAGHQSRHRSARLGARPSGMRHLMWGIAGNSLVACCALAALLAWGGREVQAPWGETSGPAFSQAQIDQWSQEMVDEQVSALGCDTHQRLSPRLAVRNAVGFDRGVVRVVSFDAGFKLAKAGKVWVVGWCG